MAAFADNLYAFALCGANHTLDCNAYQHFFMQMQIWSCIMKSSWPLKSSNCHSYLRLGLAQTIQLLPKGVYQANQACSKYINYGCWTSRNEFYNHNGDEWWCDRIRNGWGHIQTSFVGIMSVGCMVKLDGSRIGLKGVEVEA